MITANLKNMILITSIIGVFMIVLVMYCFTQSRRSWPTIMHLPSKGNPVCGISRLRGQLQDMYSLVPNIVNTKYNVHIISCYEGDTNGPDSFPIHRGNETVRGCNIYVDVEVDMPDSRPIILVLASQQPVNWQLSVVAPDVQIERVVLISCHVITPEITHVGIPRVLKVSHAKGIPSGYGDDTNREDITGMFSYICKTYGSIASFTGCHSANRWHLKIRGGMQEPIETDDIPMEDLYSSTEDTEIVESDLLYHEYLGGGASGEVYRVSWTTRYHGVIEAAAKKVRMTNNSIDDEIQLEVEILKKLNHENVIKLFGTLITNPYLILLTELAAKGSLHAFLKRTHKLPSDLLYNWLLQSASAIQYSHHQGIVHCDIKSSNFVISANYVLKLCDLGIAVYLTHTTSTSNERGTAYWLAPEVFKDGLRSPASDIFSYGIVVWELVTCKSPHKGKVPEHVKYQVGTNDLRPAIPSDCSSPLRKLMENCWDADYHRRPDSDTIVNYIQSHHKHIIQGLVITSGSHVESHPVVALSKPSDAHDVEKWNLVREFEKDGGDVGISAHKGIAVFQNGDVFATCFRAGEHKVYIYDRDGVYKFTLKSLNQHPKSASLFSPIDVAVTSKGHLVVVDQSKFVKLFHVSGSFVNTFCTLTPDDDLNTDVLPVCVAVTHLDEILVGDRLRQLVTIHAQADKWAPKIKVAVPMKPTYVASNRGYVLVSDSNMRKVIALSFQGRVVFTIDEFRVDGQAGRPYGVVCDNNGDIYIAVIKLSTCILFDILGSGHIHQYNEAGVFIRCIIKGMYHPLGITMSKGSLYVAGEKILIYGTGVL